MMDPPAIHIMSAPLIEDAKREIDTSNRVASSTKAEVSKGPTAIRLVRPWQWLEGGIPPTAPHPKAKVKVNASFFHLGQLRGSLGESEG